MHRVVKSNLIYFEDIKLTSLEKVLSKNPIKYITSEAIDTTTSVSDDAYYLITFDDGYSSDYDIVFPLLKKRNIRATFFVNPQTVGQNGYVTWAMLQEMSDFGMSIESHSFSHPNMTHITLDRAKEEFINSRKIISEILNKKVTLFSFPFGFYNINLLNLATECGYEKCFVSDHGLALPEMISIPRNSINKTMSINDINKILRCSIATRIKWKCNDFLKYNLKKMLGIKLYVFLRNRF